MDGSGKVERAAARADAVCAVIVISCLVVALLMLIDGVYPAWLSGAGGNDPNHLRSFLELINFLANSTVAFAVWYNQRFSRQQAADARGQNELSARASSASTFLTLLP